MDRWNLNITSGPFNQTPKARKNPTVNRGASPNPNSDAPELGKEVPTTVL
jgi:hypothetical protein